MPVQSATTLKNYFKTGDMPTQAQFADLIDTLFSMGAPPDPRLDYPLIGLIGPSTMFANTFAATGPGRVGGLATGPLTWALMSGRLANMRNYAKTTSPYIAGSNQAVGGAQAADFPGQIALLKDEMAGKTNWIAWYEVGRNDLGTPGANATGQMLIDWTLRDLASLREAGAVGILVSQLWPRPVSLGGIWAAGASARTALAVYRNWLNDYAASNADISIVPLWDVLKDPESPVEDVYPWVYRDDKQHYSAVGARRAGKLAVNPALLKFAKPRTYPPRSDSSLHKGFSGTTGTKTGGPTGNVVDGWGVTLFNGGADVACSVETIEGSSFQTVALTNITGAGINHYVAFKKLAVVPVEPGRKVGLRFRLIIPATLVPYTFLIGFGEGGAEGDTTQARAWPLAPANQAGSVALIPLTGWATTPLYDGTEDQDLWIESQSYILSPTAGCSVSTFVQFQFDNKGGADAALTFKAGQFQTFDVP